jgi:uncharacterized protein (UPF0548 family)
LSVAADADAPPSIAVSGATASKVTCPINLATRKLATVPPGSPCHGRASVALAAWYPAQSVGALVRDPGRATHGDGCR